MSDVIYMTQGHRKAEVSLDLYTLSLGCLQGMFLAHVSVGWGHLPVKGIARERKRSECLHEQVREEPFKQRAGTSANASDALIHY